MHASSSRPEAAASPASTAPVGKYRWTICALLFFATTINYIDRQILGLLAPILQVEIGWTSVEYSYIVAAFTAAYAVGLVGFGWLIDRFGTKIGYVVSITGWSIAAMLHAPVRSAFGFGVARAGLGLSEAGNFPAAIKAVAEWFPKKERALATGIFNSGANIGAVAAPAVVPWLTVTYGWPAAFILTGAIGFLWLIFWLIFYDAPSRQKRVGAAELAYIQSEPPEPPAAKIRWLKLFRYRQTWAFVVGKFLTDAVWWFYIYWLPLFLNNQYHLTITTLGLPLIIIYTMTSVGSIGGGWLSSRLISGGWTVNRARKLVMFICAVLVVPIVFASQVSSLWTSVLLIGLAAAAHQGWSANLFTTVSDMFPKRAVGSVVGLGGMAGSLGGVLFPIVIGRVLAETNNNYLILFVISASLYLIALGCIQMLTPTMKPAELEA